MFDLNSYLRGEAHANSDNDVMVVLDMDRYRAILKKIGFYEKEQRTMKIRSLL